MNVTGSVALTPCGQAGQREGGDHTGEQTDDRYGQSLPENEFEDIASLRSDGDANAELTRALADCVSHHAVKSNCGQREREQTEDAQERCCHAL
jgi:hypothetical protein